MMTVALDPLSRTLDPLGYADDLMGKDDTMQKVPLHPFRIVLTVHKPRCNGRVQIE